MKHHFKYTITAEFAVEGNSYGENDPLAIEQDNLETFGPAEYLAMAKDCGASIVSTLQLVKSEGV